MCPWAPAAICCTEAADEPLFHACPCADLLLAAEQAGFEVMLTADQRIRYQQNLTGAGWR